MSASKLDGMTLLLRIALRVLGAGHGIRLAFGAILGFVLDGCRQASMVMLADEKLVLALEKAGPLTAITLGILLAFLPLLFKKRVVNEDQSELFNTLDEVCPRGRLPDLSRRRAYEEVLKKVVQSYSPSEKVSITRIIEDVTQQEAKSE